MLQKIIEEYSKITQKCSINNIGTDYLYYYADDKSKSSLLATDVLEIDITRAFPTICKIIFGNESEIVQKIFSIEDKLERNIFISTSLKEMSSENSNYIQLLNMYAKIICLGKIYNDWDNISILEYKKDGAVFTAIPKSTKNQYFDDFLVNNNVEFHINEIDIYLRFNTTSVYKSKKEISVKGKYKNPPLYIKENLNNILTDPYSIEYLLNHYNNDFFNILKYAKLFDTLKYYYAFENKFITKTNEFSQNVNDCFPKNILRSFVFPILNLLRTF
jgi:hypothetical protein